MKRFLLLFSLLTLFAWGMQAGIEKDSTFWYVSGHPGVTIGFDGPYKTTRVDEAGENKKEIIYTNTASGNYSLTIIHPKAEQKLGEDMMEVFKQEIAYQIEYYQMTHGEPLEMTTQPWKVKSSEGFSTHFDLKDYRYYYRVVVLDNTMYILAVTAPLTDKDNPAIKTFMDGFKTVKPIDPEE